MTPEEPSEDAKCMAVENGDGNGNKTNGRFPLSFSDKIRSARPEQRQSLLAALLLFLLIVFFIIIIVLAVKLNSTSSDLHDRCYSPDCLASAAKVIENMDRSVDPCEDFQKFACGGYLLKHPLNTTVTKADLLDEVRASLRAKTRQLIDEITPEEERSLRTVRGHVSKFFQSCIDTRTLTDRTDKVIEKDIRSMGGWAPLGLKSYDTNLWDFDKSLRVLMKDYGVYPFFKFQVKLHGRGGSRPMIMVSWIII